MLNILSLFDGISCGQVALSRFGVPYKYFASEITPSAIQITQKNFPNTFQLWSVCDIRYSEGDLFHWKVPYKGILSWPRNSYIRVWKFPLLIWGSPCRWFSFAWKMLNFEDIQSKLFFEFVRLVKLFKPKIFVLENVRMKKEWQDIITDHLFWVEPIFIDSQNIGGQQRKRLYWIWELQSNWIYKKIDIPNVTGPGRNLQEFLEKNVDEKYYLNAEEIEKAKINCLWKTFKSWKKNGNAPLIRTEKALCLTHRNFWKFNRQTNRVQDFKGIRILTPVEEERLQWLPDNYTAWFLDYARREHIGNWFHVDTMEYILSFIIPKLCKKM